MNIINKILKKLSKKAAPDLFVENQKKTSPMDKDFQRDVIAHIIGNDYFVARHKLFMKDNKTISLATIVFDKEDPIILNPTLLPLDVDFISIVSIPRNQGQNLSTEMITLKSKDFLDLFEEFGERLKFDIDKYGIIEYIKFEGNPLPVLMSKVIEKSKESDF